MVLNGQQLETIAKIQAGLVRIEQIRKGINEALTANSLQVKGMNLRELGALVYALDGLLFNHDLSIARREESYSQNYIKQEAA
jgi:hypothetical protein